MCLLSLCVRLCGSMAVRVGIVIMVVVRVGLSLWWLSEWKLLL